MAPNRSRRRTLLVVAIGVAAAFATAQASAGDAAPRLPCGGAPVPAYAELGAQPNVLSLAGKAARAWTPPSCSRWPPLEAEMVVAVAGSFRHDGGIDGLLTRIGAISTKKGVRYWSTTDGKWQPLLTDAFALSGPDASMRRADFSAAQVAAGQTLYHAQNDNRTAGDCVFRERVLVVEPERVMIESENVSPLRKLMLTLFEPGEMQSVYFIEKRAPGVWGFYVLTRLRMASSLLPAGSDASYINRSVALFRHIGGIPTDQDPPVAR